MAAVPTILGWIRRLSRIAADGPGLADAGQLLERGEPQELIIDYVRAELENDKELLAKVIPAYPPYGKRMLRDNHWYRMLKRPNVKLVTGSISHATADAIVMEDGTVHPADVIIMATGFQASKMLWPMDIRGRGGRTIRGVWGDDDPRAYLVSVHKRGFFVEDILR